jgi:transposase
MRGDELHQEPMFSYRTTEMRVPQTHPLRPLRRMCDEALRQLSPIFEGLYSHTGRPSIAPEMLLRALLLQALYSIASERLLIEQLDYNLLFRWFVGLSMDAQVWDATVFTKNRDRLIEGEVAQEFFQAVKQQAETAGLLSDEHFTVDGTLIEAWASRRSFERKAEPPSRGTGARGRKLLRDTHESKTDPEARLFKRAGTAEARPSYLGHVISENRHGLVVEACVTQSETRAEREAALRMLQRVRRRPGATLGADKAYQEESFIAGLRQQRIVPHVAEYAACKNWPNWLREEERQHPGFARSQQKRKLVEQVFGWIKSAAGMRRPKLRGRKRVQWVFCLAVTAYNLVRMRSLLLAQTA